VDAIIFLAPISAFDQALAVRFAFLSFVLVSFF